MPQNTSRGTEPDWYQPLVSTHEQGGREASRETRWLTPVSSALRKLKQEDVKFQANPGNVMKSYLKKDPLRGRQGTAMREARVSGFDLGNLS